MRTDCTTMAARQDSCADREGPGRRGHLDKMHSYALDLLLDQGHWTGRPAQVRTAFGDNRKHCRLFGQDARRRQRAQHSEIALFSCEEVWQANPCADDSMISVTETTVGNCEDDESWPYDLRQKL